MHKVYNYALILISCKTQHRITQAKGTTSVRQKYMIKQVLTKKQKSIKISCLKVVFFSFINFNINTCQYSDSSVITASTALTVTGCFVVFPSWSIK